jgi:hypothetical protein
MDFIKETVLEQKKEVKRLWRNKRDLAFQALTLGLVVFSALLAWKALVGFTESDSPVVVVLSGSMEPLINRGKTVRFILFSALLKRSSLQGLASCLAVWSFEKTHMPTTTNTKANL